jgi:O-acetyl-ADP-ribose deacetylase (regulator of RNase III)
MRDVEGKLLSIAKRGEAIGHGCNCRGVMGGLAGLVEKRWPAMAAEYRARCNDSTFTLGGVFPWLDEQTGVWIYNLATQQEPGADARLDAIADSVRAAISHARANAVSTIYLPRMGAGIGGLKWDDVRDTLETVDAVADDVELVLVTLPSRGS